MSQFYKGEANTFRPSVVVKAFKKVGMSPRTPEVIGKKCMENSPTRSEQVTDESIKAAVVAIKECEQEKW